MNLVISFDDVYECRYVKELPYRFSWPTTSNYRVSVAMNLPRLPFKLVD